MWRNPDNVTKSKGNDHLTLDTLDVGILNLIVHPDSRFLENDKSTS